MRRGSLIAGALSLAGSVLAFAVVAMQRDVVSMFTAIGFVLLANAFIRLKLASAGATRGDEDR